MRKTFMTEAERIVTMIIFLLSIATKGSAQRPYTMFGDNSKMLEATRASVPNTYRILSKVPSGATFHADFDLKAGIALLSDSNNNVILRDIINENAKAMFTTIDPHSENYYHLSPYSYCGGNPINVVDSDGMDIYMLFYTTGNRRGDEMFKSAAETRKYDIEHSNYYDATNDLVLMCGIQDISSIESLVDGIVETYGDRYGKTAEFSIWSHAGKDGPTGTRTTSRYALDEKQMTLEGWGNIDYNWAHDASANFYGCKTGVGDYNNPSFSTRISALKNYRGVNVHGQTSSAYPSIYTNVRQNNKEMMNGIFSYPTYMVGGPSLGISGRFFPTSTNANPMRTSRDGKGTVNKYYQPGKCQ